jgi:hypothetical protein
MNTFPSQPVMNPLHPRQDRSAATCGLAPHLILSILEPRIERRAPESHWHLIVAAVAVFGIGMAVGLSL